MNTSILSDRYRRRVNYLRVSITDRCNLRCTYCMPAGGVRPLTHSQILSYEEILRVVQIAVGLGVEKIRVTGGEPLVRKGVLPFIAQLAEVPGVRDFSLTTNGVQLAEMAPALRQAGLRRVNVSLDTLQAERFEAVTRYDGLGRVLAGLAAARRAGLVPIKVNVVAMRGVNDDEILDFAAFAEREGYQVRFIEFMPSTAATAWDAAQMLPAAEILDILQTRYRLHAVEQEEAAGPSRNYRLPGGGTVGVISPLSHHFCGSCNRLRLTASGRLRSCLFSEEETDLRALLRAAATDTEISAVLRETVQRKPQRHLLERQPQQHGGLAMNRVGG